jgi:hypothetical protein
MKYIANILTDKQFSDNELYNVVSERDKLISGIPTLVIGWGYTKKMYPEANILNWKIDEDTFWTYGKRERRSKYDDNLIEFKKMSFMRFIKSIKYRFYSVLTSSEEEKEYIISLFTTPNGSLIYIKNDMIYILDGSIVVGVSLRDIEYIGGDKKEYFSKIYSNKKNVIIDIKDDLTYDTKIFLSGHNYVIPYLYA